MRLREALQVIYERNGELSPTIIVDEASDPQDEAAEYFTDRLTWDDDDAAHRWRLEEAAHLIRKAKVVYKPTPKSGLREVRAFWPVPTETGSGYVPTADIAADPMLSKMMLQQAEREWRELKARYGHLSEFVEMVQRDMTKAAA